jgi:F-box/leucine-rich repeat protein 2/20
MRLRAGRVMLERVAARFSCLTDLDISEDTTRSFYPGWQDDDLGLISRSFGRLERLNLNNCKGLCPPFSRYYFT